MSYKLLAFDLDGTLLRRDGRLSADNRQALLAAMARGIHVCIATGRALDTIPQEMLSIPGVEYVITGNGSAVYRLPSREQIRSLLLPKRDVRAILEATKAFDVTYEAFNDGRAYGSRDFVADPVRFGATEAAVPYIQSTRRPVDDIEAFILAHELDALDIVVADDQLMHRVVEAIRQSVAEVYITSSVPRLVEISHRDSGKAGGLKYLADRLGIEAREVMAFGDADNDREMLRYAGCGVAMGNALETLRAEADYVTLHHEEDGVAHALRQLLRLDVE